MSCRRMTSHFSLSVRAQMRTVLLYPSKNVLSSTDQQSGRRVHQKLHAGQAGVDGAPREYLLRDKRNVALNRGPQLAGPP